MKKFGYYPFGMMMPGRKWNNGSIYQYGFGGKRKDNEMYGEGNAYDFGNRIYDPRIARWLSLDPLQRKYPAFSPYNYSLNSPLFYQDVDGKDVGVTIIKGENGKPGKIIFSSTQYVDGVDATQKIEIYQNAFNDFIKANPGMKTSDGKWDIEFQMTFKVAESEDIDRILNAKAGELSDNLIKVDNNSKGIASAGHKAGKKYGGGQLINGKWASSPYDIDKSGGSASSGNKINMFADDEGDTGVHETLHNWGLGDRYSDISYTKVVETISSDGKILTSTTSNTKAVSVDHVGYEGTVMAKGMCVSQTNIDDLANAALKMQSEIRQDNFVMAIKVDKSNNTQVNVVRQKTVTESKYRGAPTYRTTMTNPQHKARGTD